MKKEELLNEQVGNTLTTGEVGELIKRNDVLETPFTVIETENGSFIALGNYMLTRPTDGHTSSQLVDKIIHHDWNLIVNLVLTLFEIADKTNKEEEKGRYPEENQD